MKSAEEWVNLDTGSVLFHCAEDYATDKDWIELVKQIQLDAWKQGMNDAATIATDLHLIITCEFCSTQIAEAIKADGEDRKEI